MKKLMQSIEETRMHVLSLRKDINQIKTKLCIGDEVCFDEVYFDEVPHPLSSEEDLHSFCTNLENPTFKKNVVMIILYSLFSYQSIFLIS